MSPKRDLLRAEPVVSVPPRQLCLYASAQRHTMAAGLKSERHHVILLINLHNLRTAVILLSFVLAVGFLMIILSCALWANWLPLLVGGWWLA